MGSVLDYVSGHPRHSVSADTVLVTQGQPTSPLLVLVSGSVEVLRDDVQVARVSTPGAVFGEMSALLNTPCTATVRTLAPTTFARIEDPLFLFRSSPEVTLHVARLLAQRLDTLNRYLVDVKRQYEGHDHLGMVDEVLETLLHRQPRNAS